MKQFNHLSQVSLLVVGSALFALGQSVATKDSDSLVPWLMSKTNDNQLGINAAAPTKNSAASQDGLAKLATLPPAAQSVISGALGADLPAYQVQTRANGFHAESQSLVSDFTPQGVEINGGSAHLHMTLEAYGHGDGLKNVSSTSATRVSPNRVEYRHEGLTEWYINGPLGLEQGITVDQPGKGGDRPLTVALAMEGNLIATLEEGGKGLSFSNRGRGTRVEYAGLVSTDADGKELPSRLELHGQRLLIVVNDAGARYPVTIDPRWTLDSTFSGFDPYYGAGVSVAIDFHIDPRDYTVVVGAPGGQQPLSVGGNGTNSGVAYVFESHRCLTDGCWTQFMLYPSDGANGDYFGQAVAIEHDDGYPLVGKTIVVGAPNHTVNGNAAAGESYVFVKQKTWWTTGPETSILTDSPKGNASSMFGFAVAVSFNMAVIGEPQMCGSGCGAGSAYVFQPNGPWPATMLPTTTLYPNVGLPVGSEMGFSVAISGSQGDGGGVHTAIVGAPQIASGPGLAYIYQEPSTGWPSTMTPTAELDNPYSSQDQFGYSVSITRSFLVIVGAPLATCEHSTQPRCPVGYPAQTGLAYGFRRPITRNWVNTAAPNVTMYPSDGQSGDLFGTAVGLGPWGVVGAPLHSNGINQGKGYFFGPYWGQAWPFADRELKVNGSVNPTGLNSDFGWSVGTAYEGRSAIVFGAPESNGYSGAAYLYIQ